MELNRMSTFLHNKTPIPISKTNASKLNRRSITWQWVQEEHVAAWTGMDS